MTSTRQMRTGTAFPAALEKIGARAFTREGLADKLRESGAVISAGGRECVVMRCGDCGHDEAYTLAAALDMLTTLKYVQCNECGSPAHPLRFRFGGTV